MNLGEDSIGSSLTEEEPLGEEVFIKFKSPLRYQPRAGNAFAHLTEAQKDEAKQMQIAGKSIIHSYRKPRRYLESVTVPHSGGSQRAKDDRIRQLMSLTGLVCESDMLCFAGKLLQWNLEQIYEAYPEKIVVASKNARGGSPTTSSASSKTQLVKSVRATLSHVILSSVSLTRLPLFRDVPSGFWFVRSVDAFNRTVVLHLMPLTAFT